MMSSSVVLAAPSPNPPSLPSPDSAPPDGTAWARRAEWILAGIAYAMAAVILVHGATYYYQSDHATGIMSGVVMMRNASIFLPKWRFINDLLTMPTLYPNFLYGLLYVISGSFWFTRVAGIFIIMAAVSAAMMYAAKPLGVRPVYALLGSLLMFSPVNEVHSIWFFYPVAVIASLIALGYWTRLCGGIGGRAQWILTFALPLAAFSQGYASSRMITFYLPLVAWAFLLVIIREWREPNVNPRRWLIGARQWLEPLTWLVANVIGHSLSRSHPLVNISHTVSGDQYKFLGITEIRDRAYLFFDRLAELFAVQPREVVVISVAGVCLVATAAFLVMLAAFMPRVWRANQAWARVLGVNLMIAAAMIVIMIGTDFSRPKVFVGRYIFWMLPLLALSAALVLAWCRRSGRNHWLFAGAIVLVVTLRAASLDYGTFAADIANPPMVRRAAAISDYLDRHGLTNGYATYWNAGAHELAMNESHLISPVSASLLFYIFHTENWRYTPAYADGKVFLLLTPQEEKKAGNTPSLANLLAKATRLDEPVPLVGLHAYVFASNPFLSPSATLSATGAFDFKPASDMFIRKGPHEFDGDAVLFTPGPKRRLYGPHQQIPEGKYRLVVRYGYPAPPKSERLRVGFDMVYFGKDKQIFAAMDLPTDRAEVEFPEINVGPGINGAQFRILFKDDATPFRIESFDLTRLP